MRITIFGPTCEQQHLSESSGLANREAVNRNKELRAPALMIILESSPFGMDFGKGFGTCTSSPGYINAEFGPRSSQITDSE